MNRLEKIILTGAALVTLGAGLVYGYNKKDYLVTPTEPTPIVTPAPTQEPTITPTPTLEATVTPEITGPYKLYAPTATPEEFNNFNSALDKAWGIVKNVYGMEPNDKIVVYTNTSKQTYGISLMQEVLDARGSLDFLKTPHDDIGGYTIRHFNPEEPGLKHEIAHRFNQSLFPTKNNIEPWYNTFDEGSAMYASGEIDEFIRNGAEKPYKEYKENPDKWKSRLGGVPGHTVGYVLFVGLSVDYNLTPEKNTIALKKLAEYYKEPGIKTNKEMIKAAYEQALGVSLEPLFKLLESGITLLYK